MGRKPIYQTPEEKQAALRDNWRRSKASTKDRDKAKRDSKRQASKDVDAQLQALFEVPGPTERRSMIALLARLMPKGA